jgi:hypothetical protein
MNKIKSFDKNLNEAQITKYSHLILSKYYEKDN